MAIFVSQHNSFVAVSLRRDIFHYIWHRHSENLDSLTLAGEIFHSLFYSFEARIADAISSFK